MTDPEDLMGKYVLVTYAPTPETTGVYGGTVVWAADDGRSIELSEARYIEADPPNEFVLLRLATFGEVTRKGKIKPSYTAPRIRLLDYCRVIRPCTTAVGEKIQAHPFEA